MIPPHLHFALFITFLTLFLKLLDLEERVPKASAGMPAENRNYGYEEISRRLISWNDAVI
jgi:hypothetical protein